jgi:hypothetical protein
VSAPDLLTQLAEAQRAYHEADAELAAILDQWWPAYQSGEMRAQPLPEITPVVDAMIARAADFAACETRLAWVGRHVVLRRFR